MFFINFVNLDGKPLIFVIKCDETKLVKNQKLKCLGISLINKALSSIVQKNDKDYVPYQFERKLWPIDCCHVFK
jgi:hypothetical protein